MAILTEMKVESKFVLLGGAGYVAPKHFKAIVENNCMLMAVCDRSDSIGAIDRYFPDALYFSEIERFERFIYRYGRDNAEPINFLTVCTPNYLHDSHTRSGLRAGLDVICEKPIVVNPRNLEEIVREEERTGRATYSILQLRLHPEIMSLKAEIEKSSEFFNVDLRYVTPRGDWYHRSWKGDEAKSGGICANIGIHFFDLLGWLFEGEPTLDLFEYGKSRASGRLEFKNAKVDWFLSVDRNDISASSRSIAFERVLKVNEQEIDLSVNFNDLHTESYKQILNGEGFRAYDSLEALLLLQRIRKAAKVF